MKQLSFIILFSSILFLGSCDEDLKNEKILADSLMTEIKKAEDVLNTMSSLEINDHYEYFNNSFAQLQDYTEDTLSKEELFIISDVKILRKSLLSFNKNLEFNYESLAYSKTQLENLKEDLNNNLLEPEQFKVYIASEKEAIERSLETVGHLQVWYDSSINKVEEMKTKIEKIKEKVGIE